MQRDALGQSLTRRAVLAALASSGALLLSACAGGGALAPPPAPTGATTGTSANGSKATVSASASATTTRPAGNSELVYYNFFATGDPQSVVFPHFQELFAQQEPNVKITSDVVTGIPQLESKLEVLVAGGTPPDVATINPQIITPLSSKGILADVSPDIQRAGASYDPGDFFPQTLTRVLKNGKQYGVPLQMGVFVIIYNRTLFDKAGVAYPDDSWQWQTTFLSAAQQLTKGSGAQKQFGTFLPPMELPIWADGGEVLSDDGKTCLLDHPEAITALQWLSDLRFKYQVAPTPGDLQDTNATNVFMSGRVAMDVDITGTVSRLERAKLPFDWDLAHVPSGPKGRFTIVQGPSMTVFQQSKQRDIAWKFVELYTGKDVQLFQVTQGRVVSARKSAAAAYEALPPPPMHRKPLVDSVDFGRQRLFLTNYAQVDDAMTKNLDDTLSTNSKPAAQAAQNACREVTALLQS